MPRRSDQPGTGTPLAGSASSGRLGIPLASSGRLGTPPSSVAGGWFSHPKAEAESDGHGIRRCELQCHNPQCSFLVHREVAHGGFCCKRCHWVYMIVTGSGDSGRKKHGVKCEHIYVGQNAIRAQNVPPFEPIPGAEVQPQAIRADSVAQATRDAPHWSQFTQARRAACRRSWSTQTRAAFRHKRSGCRGRGRRHRKQPLLDQQGRIATGRGRYRIQDKYRMAA
jgi:hypothetical protein